MKNLTLISALMLMAFCVLAKDESDYLSTNLLARNILSSPATKSFAAPRRYGGGSSTYFFLGVEFGYSSGKYTLPDTVVKGGGFMYTMELGAKITIPCRRPYKTGLLSISASFSRAPMAKIKLGFVSVPISYTRMGLDMGDDGTCFYWQAGVNVRYVSDASASDKDVQSSFGPVLLDPCIGFGLSTPFTMLNRRGGDEVGGGRVQIGPSFSYSVMNLAKTGTLHGFMIGLRYQYTFM